MTERVLYLLLKNGYKEMISRGEETGYRIYYDMTMSVVNAVVFVDAVKYSHEFLDNFRASFAKSMEDRHLATNDMLVLCVNTRGNTFSEQMSVAIQVCADNKRAWIYDEDTESLMEIEGQTEEFFGLKRLLEGAKFVTVDQLSTVRIAPPEEEIPITTKERFKKIYDKCPKATSVLVLINVLVFIVCELTGTVLYYYGSVGLSMLTGPDQYYRLISSMFLHLNSVHLFSNMLLLYFLGDMVEKEIKPVKFLVIYFISGLMGSVWMFVSDVINSTNSALIGASGAVYGILGALLALVIFKRINNGYTKIPRVIFAIFISLYSGFSQNKAVETGISQTGIANWAHVGGLVTGFLFCLIFCLITKIHDKREQNED